MLIKVYYECINSFIISLIQESTNINILNINSNKDRTLLKENHSTKTIIYI